MKEINMQYDKCFDEVKRDFIRTKCDTIKSKYVPLGLGWFYNFPLSNRLSEKLKTFQRS